MVFASLSNRIFLASAALVVVVIGTTAAFVGTRVRTEAERELRRGLIESGNAVDRQSGSLSGTFTLLARLIADLPKLKAAVATADPPTVGPLAAEYREMLRGSSFVVVTDRLGNVLANEGPGVLPANALAALPSVAGAMAGRETISFLPHADGVLQVLGVPISVGRAPVELAGTLSVGFVLDNALAADFKELTGSEIAFGLGPEVRSGSLPQAMWPRLGALPLRGGVTHVSVGEDDYIALARPLGSTTLGARPDAVSTVGAPFVVVARSQTARLRFLAPIQTFIGGAALAAVLLATILSYAVARTITRPLGAITTVMREVAATGDLTRRIPPHAGRWQDEDARLLAATFNTLTESIAAFERDAAQRERLSSLGRLSSVVAHEVRNPLMIMKAALRTLQQQGASPGDRDEAIQDIEGEIARLNRIVSEVLDYAKPVSFQWQAADVNQICRASAEAAEADGSGVPVQLVLDSDLPEVVTDPERLRSALVNVLSNAQHAVSARSAAGEGWDDSPQRRFSPVHLHTEAAGGGGIRILIRDRGVGIDPTALPRVFEPYFTTRPGGTGLGLAIVRNVVEGLGGSIAVASTPGTGTSVRIEIPPGPPGTSSADLISQA